jgi:hypothetical protein
VKARWGLGLEVEGAGEAARAALTCEVTKRGRKQESATG